MELTAQEADKLAQKLSDRSRKVSRHGRTFLVPHKFTPSGDPISEETFNPRRDLSKLSLNDFALLAALQESGWKIEVASKKVGMDLEEAKRRYKRISYFEFEEKRAKSLAAVASPDFIAAKHVDNVFTNELEDGQRDSLKELAKISGAYKQTIVSQTNVFNLPASLSPAEEAALKELGDKIAMRKNAIPVETI